MRVRIFIFLYIYTYALFSYTTLSFAASEPQAPPAHDFLICLREAGHVLYRPATAGGTNSIARSALADMPRCHWGDPGEEIRSVIDTAIRDHGDRIANLTPEMRVGCAKRWADGWSEVAQSVWNKTDWSDVPYVHVAHPYEELDPLEQALFVRAEIERGMVLRNQASGRTDQAGEPPDCQLMWFNSLFAREENLAFFHEHALLDKFAAGELSPKVFAEFWLVIQHADMHLAFQEKALAIIERHGPEQDFPGVLVRSLRSRVETRRQGRSDGG